MNKIGINPVTIRPQPPYNSAGSNQVTFGRLGIGVGGRMTRTFQVVISPHTDHPAAQDMHIAILSEEQVIAALGHLFPAGELSAAHLDNPANAL